MDYTAEEIKVYAEKAGLLTPSKKREKVDRKHYLMYVLNYKFSMTPTEISRFFNLKQHGSATNAIENVKNLKDNFVFLENTTNVRSRFPVSIAGRGKARKRHTLTFELSDSNYKKLEALRKVFDLGQVTDVLPIIINNYRHGSK